MHTRRAAVEHPVHDLIHRRWSPRAFSDRPISNDALHQLLEAARWAPSCNNEQPWNFIVASKESPMDFERLLGCLVEANQRWAKDAAVLMIAVAQKDFAKNGKPNRYALHDVGLATMSMVLQATAMDLYVHQMAGIDLEKTRLACNVPDTHEVIAGMAIGYLGDPAKLPDDLRERELKQSTRKPQSEFVFAGQWNQPRQ